jgi:hypothetical protein
MKRLDFSGDKRYGLLLYDAEEVQYRELLHDKYIYSLVATHQTRADADHI